MHLTLIGRSYCHLCDEMRLAVTAALAALPAGSAAGTLGSAAAFALTEVDLDDHPAYEDRYGEWVPVLLRGDLTSGVEICHYHFDAEKWRLHVDT